jgi:MoaA/NifB/PqqE/SkfB family radical SAM enzyme
VFLNGLVYYDLESASIIINRQIAGLEIAIKNGLLCKVNIVHIPDINTNEIEDIAAKVADLGAYVVNIIPLKGNVLNHGDENSEKFIDIQTKVQKHIKVFTKCSRCRSDACGHIYINKTIYDP